VVRDKHPRSATLGQKSDEKCRSSSSSDKIRKNFIVKDYEKLKLDISTFFISDQDCKNGISNTSKDAK
jgi:hypothetical protein